MRSHVRKWGNSLAVRIPKPFAAELHLEQESVVELSLVRGSLVVSPATEPAITLAALLSEVTDENLQREIDTGPAVGSEVW